MHQPMLVMRIPLLLSIIAIIMLAAIQHIAHPAIHQPIPIIMVQVQVPAVQQIQVVQQIQAVQQVTQTPKHQPQKTNVSAMPQRAQQ